ncbi:hypothetical protein BS78_03G244000 [Paspalum vaginatum]|nr:hypothetical protein BS78_03G244000 [Paspalum vaginatum]
MDERGTAVNWLGLSAELGGGAGSIRWLRCRRDAPEGCAGWAVMRGTRRRGWSHRDGSREAAHGVFELAMVAMAGGTVVSRMSGDTVLVQDAIGEKVASFNGEKQAIALYNKLIHKAYKATVEEGITNGFGMGSVFFIFFSSYGLAIWYGSKLILSRGYLGGDVISILMAVMTGAMSLGNATPCMAAFTEGQSAGYRLFKTIKRKPHIDPDDITGTQLEDVKGDVDLKGVYFSYPARPDQLIFDGFSLHVSSGTTMAIVGESGSGKSTAISLVQRFYDPQAGEVLIDGINIKTLRLGWIRGKIGLVSQEPLLFMTSIKDNIIYGKENATMEEIKKAAELANAANFIDKLPNGYDTMVGQHGAQLSGGQKQRIAIARAIIKNPKILMLDEATSALDVESERIVQAALNRIMVNRTTLVVAHRLSTVRNADCISVVQHGKIVEQGPHDALVLNPDGAYSQLIRLQESQEEKERLDHSTSHPRSKTRSQSLKRSISIDSTGNSNHHSFTLSSGLPGSVEFLEGNDTNRENQKHAGDHNIAKKAPMGRAIKTFYEPKDQLRRDSSFWGLMCVLLGVIAIISIPIEQFLFGVAGGKLIERIRSLSFRHIVHQEIAWFDDPKNSSGALGARLSVDALNVRRLVGDNLALAAQESSTLITGFLIAMIADWKLCLIILCVIPLVGLQGYAQIKFLKGFSGDAKLLYEDASQVATDAVSNIRTVASYSAEKRVMTMYNRKCKVSKKQGIRAGIVGGLGFGFAFLILYITFGLCFYVGAQFVRHKKSTFGDVFKVFFALIVSTIGMARTSAMASDSTKAKDSAISLFDLLDRKSEIDSSSDVGLTMGEVKGNIDFQNVSFKYPSRPDVQIFSGFTLHIPAAKTVALVGESGSGKSTVISLLERFYNPDSGSISLDGVELKNLKINRLRDHMGLVSQEPVLFNDTIRANIAYGKREEVTEEELIKVAKAANAHEFISSLPRGYDTTVGERGVQLSGGQKQRVAIARDILKDPRIILLDEATSALDAESERIVQDALDHVMVGRTTVIVAHRLSTIKGADIIAVLTEAYEKVNAKPESSRGCNEATTVEEVVENNANQVNEVGVDIGEQGEANETVREPMGEVDEGEEIVGLVEQMQREDAEANVPVDEDSDSEDEILNQVSSQWTNFDHSELLVNEGEMVPWEYSENEVSVGAIYHSKIELKEAVQRWSAKCLKKEFRVQKSSPQVYDVKCIRDDCPFRVHVFLEKYDIF